MFANIHSRLRALEQKPYIVVGCITLFGALLRLYHLGYKSLWLDEAVLYWISNNSLTGVIRQNAIWNSAPPLFSLLTSLVSNVASSEIGLRFLPWLGGVLAVPAAYFLSRQFSGRIPSYIVASLVVFAPTQVQYSQQVREYSLSFLVATLMLAFYCRLLRQLNWENSVILSILLVFGIFLQYGLALLTIAINIAIGLELLWQREHKRALLLSWAAIQIPVLIAVILVYSLSLHQQMRVAFGTGPGSSDYLAAGYWNGSLSSLVWLATINSAQIIWFAFPDVLFFFLFIVGFIASFKNREYRRPLALFNFSFAITFIFAVARLYPFEGVRQDIYLTPMLYSFAGIGFTHLLRLTRRQWVVATRVTLLCLVILMCIVGFKSTVSYLNNPGIEDIRPIIQSLSSSFQQEDRIYVYYGAKPVFDYYFREHQDSIINGVRSSGNLNASFEQLDIVLSQKGRVWMVLSDCFMDECNAIRDYVSERYDIEFITEGVGAFLYMTNGVTAK